MGYKRRNGFEISKDILLVCLHSEKKTRVVYQANLNSLRVNDYLDWLVNAGLLAKNVENQAVTYHTTELGVQFLKCYQAHSALKVNCTTKKAFAKSAK